MHDIEAWALERIEECEPGNGLGTPALQRLMHAAVALETGSGDLFGMSVQPGFVAPSSLYPRACEVLQAWMAVLDEHLESDQCEQVFDFVRAHALDVTVPDSRPAPSLEAVPAPTSDRIAAADSRLARLEPLWSEAEWAQLEAQWKALVDRRTSGFSRGHLELGPPLDAATLARLESSMSRPIPDELVRAGLNARSLAVDWSLPPGADAAPEFPRSGGGMLEGIWSLDALADIAEGALEWCFDFLDSDEKRLWTESVAFGQADANYLAMLNGRVVFLHHENDPGLMHGRTLAPNLKSFIERWTSVGCPAPQWGVLEHLVGEDGIDPDSDFAKRWASFRQELARVDFEPDWLASAFEDED